MPGFQISLDSQGYEYQVVYDDESDKAWEEALSLVGGNLTFIKNFYKDEWVKIVQAQEVYDKAAYCKASELDEECVLTGRYVSNMGSI